MPSAKRSCLLVGLCLSLSVVDGSIPQVMLLLFPLTVLVHNLFELLTLSELCGFCCFSMRFVIFIDLFATLVQPASLVYIGYLVYTLFFDDAPSIPTISLILIAAIYGLQLLIII